MSVRETLQILAQRPKSLDGVCLIYDIQLAPARHHKITARKEIEVATEAALGLAHALGNAAQLSRMWRVKGQNAIRLAVVVALENYCLGAIYPRLVGGHRNKCQVQKVAGLQEIMLNILP